MENQEGNQAVTQHKPSHFFLWFLQVFTLLLLLAVAIAIAILHNNLNNRVYRLQHRVLTEQNALQKLQLTVENLTQPQMKKAGVLAQIDYLLRTANIHLNMEGNVALTIQLLKIADQMAANLNDPTLFGLRHALANDVTALQAVPKIDLPGLVLKINALSQQIPNLPFLPSKPTFETPQTTNTPAVAAPLWKRGLSEIKQALQEVVIVRHAGEFKGPLLPPEQQAYITLNIQLKLSQAEWAVMHQQTDIYQQSLQEVINWIRQYYVQNAAPTVSILKSLTDLQAAVIKPSLPDITDSINALEALENAPPVVAPAPSVKPANSSSSGS